MLPAIGKLALVLSAAIGFALGGAAEHCTSSNPWDACAASARAHISKRRLAVLLGNRTVEQSADGEAPGRSEAFVFGAGRSGVARSIALYLDSSNRATRVVVAIYGSAGGSPAALLTAGSTRHVGPGRWIRISIRSARIHEGTRYWLAVLGTGGVLRYRDRQVGGCSSVESAQANLGRLPRHWSVGKRWPTCLISAYASGRASRPAPPRTKTSPRSAPSPGPPQSSSPRTAGCVSHPSACGYPDQTNTGVPAGTALTPSGEIVVSSAGSVIVGRDVSGSIEVTANNVTIKNTRVTSNGDTGNAIHVDSGVTGTTIEDSTLRGQASTNAIQYAVANSGSGTTGLRLQMYNCSECWAGNGTLRDSYAISDATISGAHYEAVYVPGGTTSPTDLEHDTLLNPHDQTAGIFGDNHAYGPLHNFTINHNLVADGGDNGAIVTGCNGDGNTNITVTNNRISYAYNASMSQGPSNRAATTWTNNYRDDTLRQVSEFSGPCSG